MFIQVIEGKTSKPDALHRQLDKWERELRPGATGYLGSTGGCTSDGSCILIARFESAEAARRNSERQEQTTWWMDMEKLFDGPVSFHDTEDVHVMMHGDADSAGFVQVMDGHIEDHERAIALEREAHPMLATIRPDLLGTMTAYYDDDGFTEVAYFTSETAARQAEAGEMPEEAAVMFEEFQQVMHVDRYLDLTEPWLVA